MSFPPIEILGTLPSWVIVLLVIVSTVGYLLIRILKIVMPVDSKDRLSWWKEFFAYRRDVVHKKKP